MKRWLSLIAVGILCIALIIGVACGGEEEKEEGVRELKMGVGLPLSGIYGAVVGIPAKYAFITAVDEIGVFTVGGEQYRWKLFIEDNGPTSAGGVATTTKFIYEDDVDFIHQSQAPCAIASEPLCRENGIILTGSGINPEHINADTPQFFMTTGAWAVNIPPFFDWLTKEHPEVKRVAIDVADDETGRAVAEAIEDSAERYGLEVVAKEFVPTGTAERYPTATAIMAKNPDIVFTSAALFSEILWDMGFEGLCTSWFWMPGYAEEVGWEKCQGFLIVMPHPYGGVWPEAEALVAEVESRYGKQAIPVATLMAANIMYIWTDALRQAGTVDDMDKIVETMETATLNTIAGPIRFGGEVLNGIGHVAIWESPIFELVGEDEYRLIDVYSVEETEVILAEVYAGE